VPARGLGTLDAMLVSAIAYAALVTPLVRLGPAKPAATRDERRAA
jgi:hypothetical protein